MIMGQTHNEKHFEQNGTLKTRNEELKAFDTTDDEHKEQNKHTLNVTYKPQNTCE